MTNDQGPNARGDEAGDTAPFSVSELHSGMHLSAKLQGVRPPLGFTLIELVLVMALLVTLLAIVAPSLSRTMRQKNFNQEAARLLALTEYARDEAASQGVPVLVWVNPETRRFGMDVKMGYDASTVRAKEYALPDDLSFAAPEGAVASKVPGHGVNVAEFAPDGTLDPASVPAVSLLNRGRTETVGVARSADGYGYEIANQKEVQR